MTRWPWQLLFIEHDYFTSFISGYYHTKLLAYTILEMLTTGLLY